jgi:protoporphyrinogen oxidase
VLKKPFKNKKVETSLIEEFNYPKKGPGQLWEQLAALILERGGRLLLNTKVTKIHAEAGRITAVTAVSGGENHLFEADYFISSMPVKDLILGMDAAPADIRGIAGALPYRDFITVGLLLKRLEIKNETKIKTLGNIVPDCWIYIQERDVRLGRLQIFNNWSPYMVKEPEHTVFVGLEYFCNEGDDLWTMPDAEFIGFAAGELEKIGIIKREHVLDGIRINVKKAYPAYFGSYARFPEIRKFLDTFDNLYCVGRNGQHKYNNMDHSMLTAIEAVKAIKENKKDKSGIWNVNTESDYHETKTG